MKIYGKNFRFSFLRMLKELCVIILTIAYYYYYYYYLL
jgi:hypothetical protein